MAMERIFAQDYRPPTDDPDDVYSYTIRSLIQDSRNYNDDIRAPKREEFMRYYLGLEPSLDEEGRSTIVSTDVRDTIMGMLPSLIRIFTAHEHVVEFVPNFEAMVPIAEEATDYVSYVFTDDNDGFLILHSIFKDALTKGEGATKWWTDNTEEVEVNQYSNITHEQVQLLMMEKGVQITKQEPDGEGTFKVETKKVTSEPLHRVEAVPPDEFRIDRNAKTVRQAQLVGHERVVPAHELVAMGYEKEMVEQHTGTNVASARWNEERALRNEGLELGVARTEQADGVLYGEYFIRVDSDGDGIAELHRICVMGDNDEIVADEIVSRGNFAYFCADPEPHSVIGHSITELVMDLQKIKSNLIRNSLDSIAQTIFPRLVFVENMANSDDILNNELGAPIRAKSIDSVKQLEQSFIGDAPMTMINYLDNLGIRRTGQSDASKGLDPKALQSTTVKGVDMVITGAQERIELVARILAETGMKDMFRGMLSMIAAAPAPDRMVRLRGKWVKPNPENYDVRMGVRVNPALGRGSDFDRFQMLNQIKQTQELIIQTAGFDNPLVTPINYRNTCEDLLSIAGFKNSSRYFGEITEDTMKNIAEGKAAAQEKDPAYILAMNEREKLRQKSIELLNNDAFRRDKHENDDDFRRDKLAKDTILESTKINAQAREAEINREIEKKRAENGTDGESTEVGGGGSAPSVPPAQGSIF